MQLQSFLLKALRAPVLLFGTSERIGESAAKRRGGAAIGGQQENERAIRFLLDLCRPPYPMAEPSKNLAEGTIQPNPDSRRYHNQQTYGRRVERHPRRINRSSYTYSGAHKISSNCHSEGYRQSYTMRPYHRPQGTRDHNVNELPTSVLRVALALDRPFSR